MFFLIYSIIALLALYFIKVHIFSVPFTLLELMIYVLFLIWLLKKEKTVLLKGLPIVPVVLIFSGALLSAVFSQNPITGLGIVKGWFFAPLLFLFILFQTIKTRERAENIFMSLALGGFGVAAIALYYFFTGDLTFDGRLKAFYLSPNHLAMAMAPAALTSFWFLISSGRAKERIVWFFIFAFPALVLYLTYSYGAWLTSFAGIIILIFYAPLEKKVKTAAVVLGFLFFAFFIFSQIGGEKFSNVFDEHGPLASRLMIWRSAVELIKEHPILGIGPGMFQEEYLVLQPQFPPYLEWAVPQPHNIFLAFWLQTGILGFIGFIWLLILFFRTAFSSEKKQGKDIVVLCLALMVYIIIHGLVDTTYWKNDLAVVFWLVIGLFYLFDTMKNEGRAVNF